MNKLDGIPWLTFQTDFAIPILVHFVNFVDNSVNLFEKNLLELIGSDVATAVGVNLLEKLGGLVTLKQSNS